MRPLPIGITMTISLFAEFITEANANELAAMYSSDIFLQNTTADFMPEKIVLTQRISVPDLFDESVSVSRENHWLITADEFHKTFRIVRKLENTENEYVIEKN